jgi:predicted Zn finger-like uncharacterized protein
MALATKCPHCNTVFRVAHDQLKLRGGIVRCGSCNEVFDGNAALLEPLAPPAAALPLDQHMAALDTRAAEVLTVEEAEPLLQLDEPDTLPSAEPEPIPESESEPEPALEPEPAIIPGDEADDDGADAPPPFPLPAEPAVLPADKEALFDLDLDLESEPAPEDVLSDEELEAALEAELAVMEHSLADAPDGADDADDTRHANDTSYATATASNGRREPTWDDPDLDEPQAGAGPGLERAFAAADDAIFSSDDEELIPPPVAVPATAPPRRDDELDEVDEEALLQLSSAGLSASQAARAHTLLHTASADEAPALADAGASANDGHEDDGDQAAEEPGFVKRDRQRQKYGRAGTIAMSIGSLLLLAALFGQAITTFRNTLAAAMPPLKPALTAACNALGCKIELPTQIDDLTIEQGELQTLSDTAFSFTTLLRNQSATAQAWPSIELVLDDDKDKRILRRVFTPRDYLGADIALDKGFAPHTEQAVKLYFELRELKASGYHIAVFYP